jgi:hypothetical protein
VLLDVDFSKNKLEKFPHARHKRYIVVEVKRRKRKIGSMTLNALTKGRDMTNKRFIPVHKVL